MRNASESIDRSPVLVASDLCQPSDVAILEAHQHALAERRPLLVLHVIRRELRPEFLLPGMEPVEHPPVLRSTARFRLRQRIRNQAGLRDRDYRVRVERGEPSGLVLAVARESGASWIVVGAHPRDRHDHPFLGSVTERIVRHAARPVLVARGSSLARHANRLGPILAATDFSDEALPAVFTAAGEARRRGVPLFVIHSLELSPLVGGARVDGGDAAIPARLYLDLVAAAESRMAKIRERVGLEGESLVPAGPATDAILGAAERLGPSLIVVGSRHKTGWRRAVLGSVAEAVVREAKASVLVVPLHAEAVRGNAAHAQTRSSAAPA